MYVHIHLNDQSTITTTKHGITRGRPHVTLRFGEVGAETTIHLADLETAQRLRAALILAADDLRDLETELDALTQVAS